MTFFRNALFFFSLFSITNTNAQKSNFVDAEVVEWIGELKSDVRGPYKDIRWFCPDGRINDPKTPCNQEGAFQRARYKDRIVQFGRDHHLFFGQILMGSDFKEFLDEQNYFSRFKQYQLEKYLKAVDDGWINRQAQYYRGAVQSEDEMKWGREFLMDLAGRADLVSNHFYLVRQAFQTIPHGLDDSFSQEVRAVSKNISDEDGRFMTVRVKIHGQPESSDISLVKEFKSKYSNLSPSMVRQIDRLIEVMEKMYAPPEYDAIIKDVERSGIEPTVQSDVKEAFNRMRKKDLDLTSLIAVSEGLTSIRQACLSSRNPQAIFRLLDFSILLEQTLYQRIQEIEVEKLGQLRDVLCQYGQIAYGTGLIEAWEWQTLEGELSVCQGETCRLSELVQFNSGIRKAVEWGVNMHRAHYNTVLQTFIRFEPAANGFIDDLVRSGILLHMGRSIAELNEWLNKEMGFANQMEGIKNPEAVRGLNPGYAKGVLEVVGGNADELEVDPSKIYLFDQPPADLKPVAGIATVSEGNPVSHIQLLARNLGIPNAVISNEVFTQYRSMNGAEVFYAVSPKGTVILKRASAMTPVEAGLFTTQKRPVEKISVPIDELQLGVDKILDLRLVDRSFSGKACGPKAANLGELKKEFPDHVVDGMVIPFGVFKDHMEQSISGQSMTYWEYVTETFDRARDMVAQGKSENEVELFTLDRLTQLQKLIKEMPLKAPFVQELEQGFNKILGADMGRITVFLRSDTNMEDLKDFTGAGLNLTIFNVLEKNKIIQGIRDVWASPYSERSFRWRQKFLNNPENVYPSILIIPGVDVDYSGVLITRGLKSGKKDELTVAFNRGVGGAVDGQAAESHTLSRDGHNRLDAPAREPSYRHLLAKGGTSTSYTHFAEPILSAEDLISIRSLAEMAGRKIRLSDEVGDDIAQDIELGFLKHKLWLFQVRPFVENKAAAASDYLNTITPPDPPDAVINLDLPKR